MGPKAAWRLQKRMGNNVCSSAWVPGRPGGFKQACEILSVAPHGSQSAGGFKKACEIMLAAPQVCQSGLDVSITHAELCLQLPMGARAAWRLQTRMRK
jgi:hypothetical protein